MSDKGRSADRRDPKELQLEERVHTLRQATDQWLSILREMEHAGQSGDARYDTYYRAYLKTKRQLKEVELEVFNRRQGLAG